MLNVLPLPLAILANEILYYERLDTERENEFKEPILIKNCRVHLGLNKNYDVNGELVVAVGRLYLDGVHTEPLIVPKNSDKIFFRGKNYFVVNVREHYTDKLHHIEVDIQ